MSAGKDRYEERRRLESERELLHMRLTNDKLRREAEGVETFDLVCKALRAFIAGDANFVVWPDNDGNATVTFRMPPEPLSTPEGGK